MMIIIHFLDTQENEEGEDSEEGGGKKEKANTYLDTRMQWYQLVKSSRFIRILSTDKVLRLYDTKLRLYVVFVRSKMRKFPPFWYVSCDKDIDMTSKLFTIDELIEGRFSGANLNDDEVILPFIQDQWRIQDLGLGGEVIQILYRRDECQALWLT
ncbi:hypothetical protein AVEN_160279-1 [Araneus ventricosus]|uniref:Uncharacterized protein n=1 Tax=Araneus ventricosus TaxID=182803 RepID=A0A4Y2T1Y0_ARAVE|nr:hypothetical protein AVEN_160279-1 [Araneus ventricosus]